MTLILGDDLLSIMAHFVAKATDCSIETKNPTLESDVVPPAFTTPQRTDSFATCGLCNVSRQVVKYAIKVADSETKKNSLQLLLGYKQNCLKGASAISSWTDFCERTFPQAVVTMSKHFKEGKFKLAEEVLLLEKEFSVTKKTANGSKHSNQMLPCETSPDCTSVTEMLKSINISSCEASNSQSFSQKPLLSYGNNEEVRKRKKQVYWPFLCSFDVTIADLLVLRALHSLLSSMPCACLVTEFFIIFPNIFRWFGKCCADPVIKEALCELPMHDLSKTCSQTTCPFFYCDIDFTTLNHISYMKKPSNTKNMHSKIMKDLPEILEKLKANGITPAFSDEKKVDSISWTGIPQEVNPSEGELDPGRALRKRQQIENMVSLILPLLSSGDKIVEFCAGGGHLGIVVAYLRPDCQVVLVENKEESIDRALTRIQRLKLQNVSIFLSNLEHYNGSFNVGTALHACGSATDLVLRKCLTVKASFVISPCCYGSIKASKSLQYPASERYTSCGVCEAEFSVLSHSADQTCLDLDSEYGRQGKSCMLLVDYDRTLRAEDSTRNSDKNYTTSICTMVPPACSPKNNVIVGKCR